MAVVRSPDFLRALIRETALATLIHQRRLTPLCGGQAPTAERTVGPARMIAESLTPKPGIREQNRHKGDLPRRLPICPLSGAKRTSIGAGPRLPRSRMTRSGLQPTRRR